MKNVSTLKNCVNSTKISKKITVSVTVHALFNKEPLSKEPIYGTYTINGKKA